MSFLYTLENLYRQHYSKQQLDFSKQQNVANHKFIRFVVAKYGEVPAWFGLQQGLCFGCGSS